jgi:hypothetical protein
MNGMTTGEHTMNSISRIPRCLAAASLLALALLAPRSAQADGTAPACGPIEGEYFRKSPFTVDDSLTVIRQGKAYRFSLEMSHVFRPYDGSMVSNGTSNGRFVVKNCRAHFDDRENACRLEFTFKGRDTIDIVQVGSCLYGAEIDATGTFKKK